MRRYHKVLFICTFVFVLQCVMYSTAWAYIDPGTGSYLFQMLMAGLLGSLFAVKMAWRNIKVYFTQLFSQGDSQENENE